MGKCQQEPDIPPIKKKLSVFVNMMSSLLRSKILLSIYLYALQPCIIFFTLAEAS